MSKVIAEFRAGKSDALWTADDGAYLRFIAQIAFPSGSILSGLMSYLLIGPDLNVVWAVTSSIGGGLALTATTVSVTTRRIYRDRLKSVLEVIPEGVSWRNTLKLHSLRRKKSMENIPLNEIMNVPASDRRTLMINRNVITVMEPHPSDIIWDKTFDAVNQFYALEAK